MSKTYPSQIIAACFAAAGFILALVYDRPGSQELLFSGLALFVLGDVHAHKASPHFLEHHKGFQLMIASFSGGFSIFLLLGSLEIVFYTNLQPILEKLLISEAVGWALLALGIGPYIRWISKSRM